MSWIGELQLASRFAKWLSYRNQTVRFSWPRDPPDRVLPIAPRLAFRSAPPLSPGCGGVSTPYDHGGNSSSARAGCDTNRIGFLTAAICAVHATSVALTMSTMAIVYGSRALSGEATLYVIPSSPNSGHDDGENLNRLANTPSASRVTGGPARRLTVPPIRYRNHRRSAAPGHADPY